MLVPLMPPRTTLTCQEMDKGPLRVLAPEYWYKIRGMEVLFRLSFCHMHEKFGCQVKTFGSLSPSTKLSWIFFVVSAYDEARKAYNCYMLTWKLVVTISIAYYNFRWFVKCWDLFQGYTSVPTNPKRQHPTTWGNRSIDIWWEWNWLHWILYL